MLAWRSIQRRTNLHAGDCHVDDSALAYAHLILAVLGHCIGRCRSPTGTRRPAAAGRADDASTAGGAGRRQRPCRHVRRHQLDRAPLSALPVQLAGAEGRHRRRPRPPPPPRRVLAAPAAERRRRGEGCPRRLSRADARRARPRIDGIRLGEEVAAKIVAASAATTARARRMPIGRRQSPASTCRRPITASSMWPNVTPFAMTSPAQFRPQPPIALKSERMGGRLQRDQEPGRQDQHQAHCPADRGCAASG